MWTVGALAGESDPVAQLTQQLDALDIRSEDQRRDVAKLLTTEPCALLECNLYRATDATGSEPATDVVPADKP